MKKLILGFIATLSIVSCGTQMKLNSVRLMQGGAKAIQALGISNAQMQSYVRQSVAQLDAEATVLPASDVYSKRLAKITGGLADVNGIPLNFKVYKTNEVNAFACADGSVRVYTGLMDIMADNEVLGVIGHEIGHVALEHTLNAYKNALYTSAAFDAVASAGDLAAALTDSVLGQLGRSMIEARFSRKQESDADDYGYDFLKARKVNPWYMAMAFEELQKASSGGTTVQETSIGEMFSSHPNTANRIEAVSKRAAADGYTRPVKK